MESALFCKDNPLHDKERNITKEKDTNFHNDSNSHELDRILYAFATIHGYKEAWLYYAIGSKYFALFVSIIKGFDFFLIVVILYYFNLILCFHNSEKRIVLYFHISRKIISYLWI